MKKQIYIYIYKYIHHDMEKLVPTCIYIYIHHYINNIRYEENNNKSSTLAEHPDSPDHFAWKQLFQPMPL